VTGHGTLMMMSASNAPFSFFYALIHLAVIILNEINFLPPSPSRWFICVQVLFLKAKCMPPFNIWCWFPGVSVPAYFFGLLQFG